MNVDRTLDLDVFPSSHEAKKIRDTCSQPGKLALLFLLTLLVSISFPLAHSPNVDASPADWCLGAQSNIDGRVEDSSANLVCGNCSFTTNRACVLATDCPSGESCVNPGSKEELVWWDNRTDGAVNDLGTIAMTQDNSFLYIMAELWVDPDPLSLPFGEIAIDFQAGGLTVWHDPGAVLVNPGTCSVSTDRGCTSDADCHFCTISTEPFPSTRPRTCGSTPVICNNLIPGDDCITTETCSNIGTSGHKPDVGANSSPTAIGADYLLVFDFSRWLILADGYSILMQPGTVIGPGPWDPVFGCVPDYGGDTTMCDFNPAVNPGQSGGSGGPPGGVEMAVPWSAFGCTGCPAACDCPDFGPGQDFRFNMIIARGANNLDYAPDGPFEDVMSEAVAGTYTLSSNSCPGFGLGNTDCELLDGSSDAYIPAAAVPGGECRGLLLTKNAAPSITLNWNPSCSPLDDDYGVYEGDIGTFYSHFRVPTFCTTGGATTATFNYGTGNHYYLVVPADTVGSTEGSYGKDSTSTERPASTSPCQVRSLGNCP